MRVAFVGAGRVGISLACFFKSRGIPVVGIVARSEASASRVVKHLGEHALFTRMEDVPPVDVLFLTVKDSAIKDVAARARALFPHAVIVHTSGAHPSTLIPGEGRASLHPLQSLAQLEVALEVIPGSLFTLEGDEKGVRAVGELAERAGLDVVQISPQKKPLYHAAAVVASNYLVTLMYEALKILELSGFPLDRGVEGLVCLAEGTLRNIKAKGVPHALTGPIARGDWDTVRLHLEELSGAGEPEEFYRYMARLTARMIGVEPEL